MRRAAGLALAGVRAMGWAALGALAVAGVVLSGLAIYASSPQGRPVAGAALIRFAAGAVAGRLELDGVEVLPQGGIVIRGLRAFDPDGQLVLRVDRAEVAADMTRIRRKVVGLSLELDGVTVRVDEGEDGALSIVRAFSPVHPSPAKTGSDWTELGGWTVRLERLTIRGAEIRWRDRDGAARLEARELTLDARAVAAPRRARVDLKLAGTLGAPVAGAASLEVRAVLDGAQLRIPVLRARLGGTDLEGLGEGDLSRRTGRAALTRAGVNRAQARALVPATPPGADLSLAAYAEADGRVVTLAVHVEPAQAGGPGGGEAAVAVRTDGTRALGFDVATHALDPSALHGAAPRGSVTLTAHGGAAGESLAGLRGRLELALAPSRLRDGELGPVQASVRVDRGSWEASRLSLVAPGLSVEGAGRWQEGRAVSAHLTADAPALAAAGENLGRLLGTALPRLSGRAHLSAALSGTSAAPVISASVAAPELAVGSVSASGLQARGEASGPFLPGQLRVDASAARVAAGGREVVSSLAVKVAVTPLPGGAAGRLEASAHLPTAGKEPVTVEAAGALSRDRRELRLDELALGYPGTHYALDHPATLTLAGPSVDRLELASGPRRIAVTGGLGPRGALDAHLTVEQLDLAALPAGFIPAGEGIAGELGADLHATGTGSRPLVEGIAGELGADLHAIGSCTRILVEGLLAVAGDAFRTERALRAEGELRWDGAARRARVRLSLARGPGGSAVLEADAPLPLRDRPEEPISAALRVVGVPVEAILAAVRSDLPAAGRLGATARLQGTVGGPALQVELSVADGVYDDLTGVSVAVKADVARKATVHAEAGLSGQTALRADAEVPLDLGRLLARPAETARALRDARATADLAISGLDLGALAGRQGVPADLRGRLAGKAHLAGQISAPRGTADLVVIGGAWRGYTDVEVKLAMSAADGAVEARGSVRLQGQDALALTAALRAPPERLLSRGGARSAPLLAEATVPHLDLAQAAAGTSVLLGGVLEGKARAVGTLGRPDVTVDLTGHGLTVEGRSLGEAALQARAAGEKASAEAVLHPPAGGELRATLAVTVPVSADLTAAALRAAPAQASLRAAAVDLGFLPALLPTFVRAAGGKLEANVTASGPLARLAPRGTVHLADGRLAVVEYGDWNRIALDGEITEDAVELRTFEAYRGKGSVSIRATLRGLTTPSAKLDGRLQTKGLTLLRAGMELATLEDLDVRAGGTYRSGELDARLDVAPTTVRLPDKLPRELQSLDRRPDITVGPKRPVQKAHAVAGGPAAATPGHPLALKARLVVPGKLYVKQKNPRVDVELRADVTYERQGGVEYMSGTVEVVRGEAEPISGRRFQVQHAKLTFSGGPPRSALVDAEALYENTTADVTVTVSGPVTKPEIKLTSQPALDEGQIAMLIATGGTELKAGGGTTGGGTQAPSLTAASKIGFVVFNTFIRDKLPFQAINLDASAGSARLGGYIPNTSVYVGYTRRWDARADLYQNSDELHVDYAISRRWTLEGRWGNVQSEASLIWSKDY